MALDSRTISLATDFIFKESTSFSPSTKFTSWDACDLNTSLLAKLYVIYVMRPHETLDSYKYIAD